MPENNNEKVKQTELDKKLEHYQDIEGVSTKSLDFGLWFIEHKKQLRSALVIILIVISAISWSYTIYGFAYYIAKGMADDEKLISEMVRNSNPGHNYIASQAAEDLNYYPALVLKSSDKRYDFLAQLKNPNKDWWAEFYYYFTVGQTKTKIEKGFILPQETKFLLTLAQEFSYQPQVQLVIENLRWQRVNAHLIPDWNDYYASHLNIVNSDIKFLPASLSGLSEKVMLNQLDFTSVNKTPYNYWQVDYIILLFGGDNVISVNKYSLTDFMSGQVRSVNLSWPGNLGRVSKIEINPEINIMQDDIYIEFSGNGQVK